MAETGVKSIKECMKANKKRKTECIKNPQN